MVERQMENQEEAPEAVAESAPVERTEAVRRAEGQRAEASRAAGSADEERPRRRGGRRRRVCIMCADKIKIVDYKNASFLRRFISDRGRIETRRKTSACAKHQRALASAIKRARHLALLPYTAEHLRGAAMGHR